MTFKLTENDGTVVDPSTFGSNLNLLMGGPTVDYAIQPFRERADGAAFDGSVATYTFTNAIPADATGTWAFSIEARRTVTLDPPAPDTSSVTEAAFNPVAYASVDGSAVAPRRKVVDIALCNGCHGQLALHGGQRLNTEECVMCHNPNGDDASRRPADQLPARVDRFQAHDPPHPHGSGPDGGRPRLHGNAANRPTRAAASRSTGSAPRRASTISTTWFSRATGATARGATSPGTEELVGTPPAGWLTTNTPRDWYTPQFHNAAACLGCHDTQAAAAHAFLNTAPFGEACAVCHGPDGEEAVDKVHAR